MTAKLMGVTLELILIFPFAFAPFACCAGFNNCRVRSVKFCSTIYSFPLGKAGMGSPIVRIANIPFCALGCQEGGAEWRRFNISYELRAISYELIFI